MLSNNNQRLEWADLGRSVAIFGVILIHASGALLKPWGVLELGDWLHVPSLFNSLSRCAVPLFVMFSGALILKERVEIIRVSEIVRRILKVLVPLVFWTIFYLFYSAYVLGGNVEWHVLLGHPAFYHLWFVYMIIGIYLILPVLQGIYLHLLESKSTAIYVLCIWLLITSIPIYWPTQFTSLFQIPSLLGYGGYFIIGAFLARRGVNWLSLWLVAALFVLSIFATFLTTRHLSSSSTGLVDVANNYFSPNVFVASITAFLLIRKVPLSPCVNSTSNRIATLGFLMYFIHPLFIDILLRSGIVVHLNSLGYFSSLGLVLFIVTTVFAVSLIASVLLRLLPFSRAILG